MKKKQSYVFLQAHPVGERAVVVAQVQRPGGPHSAQQSFPHFRAAPFSILMNS